MMLHRFTKGPPERLLLLLSCGFSIASAFVFAASVIWVIDEDTPDTNWLSTAAVMIVTVAIISSAIAALYTRDSWSELRLVDRILGIFPVSMWAAFIVILAIDFWSYR